MILEKMNQGFPPFEGTGRGLYHPALFADRGFTGHEFLKWFNVYNMNGRLYDPLVGRFMNVDPYVQVATNSQNYNRYSYCLNNPLRFTDPSEYRMAAADEYWNLDKDITNQDRFYGFSPTGGNGGGGDSGWGGNGGAVPGWAAGSNSGSHSPPRLSEAVTRG
jgi:RHS repeat-associated protein